MGLSMGIVGLPNVGKSTLFNAITNNNIEASNFPFCTIDPNKGMVSVPDDRLQVLSKITKSKKVISAVMEFIDIAGLVKGASKGEGLGNKFLANIREVSAIVHVVRCFENDDIVHVDGSVNPVRDIDVIHTELVLSDVEQCEKAIDNQHKKTRHNDTLEVQRMGVLKQCLDALSQGKPLRGLLSSADLELIKEYNFLTLKKVVYLCNVSESDLGTTNDYVKQVQAYVAEHDAGAEVLQLSANFEHELSTLSEEDQVEFLSEYGLTASGLSLLARTSYKLLGLETFLTSGEQETRAWTIPVGTTAPKAAAEIHTDFERGFIRANVIHYSKFVDLGGFKQAKEQGVMRQEGKEYIVQDGDIVEFLFNV